MIITRIMPNYDAYVNKLCLINREKMTHKTVFSYQKIINGLLALKTQKHG